MTRQQRERYKALRRMLDAAALAKYQGDVPRAYTLAMNCLLEASEFGKRFGYETEGYNKAGKLFDQASAITSTLDATPAVDWDAVEAYWSEHGRLDLCEPGCIEVL